MMHSIQVGPQDINSSVTCSSVFWEVCQQQQKKFRMKGSAHRNLYRDWKYMAAGLLSALIKWKEIIFPNSVQENRSNKLKSTSFFGIEKRQKIFYV